jgi:hypothetical protein
MIFAQLPDPSSFISVGWILGGLAALALCINQCMGLVDRFTSKPSAQEVQQESAGKYMTATHCHAIHESSLAQHLEHGRRLDGHDAQIDQIWTTMRAEDNQTRRENGVKFESIMAALGEIKGKMGIKS